VHGPSGESMVLVLELASWVHLVVTMRPFELISFVFVWNFFFSPVGSSGYWCQLQLCQTVRGAVLAVVVSEGKGKGMCMVTMLEDVLLDGNTVCVLSLLYNEASDRPSFPHGRLMLRH
jgi:hypothetical protein